MNKQTLMAVMIERGIPIPKQRYSTLPGSYGKYSKVIRKMKVGDSVLLPVTTANATTTAIRCLGSGNFTIRTVDGGIRVWRIN